MNTHYYCLGCFQDLDEDMFGDEDVDADIEWIYVDECEHCKDELWEDEPYL